MEVTDERLLTFKAKHGISSEGFSELLGIVNDAKGGRVDNGKTDGEAIAAMIQAGTKKINEQKRK